MVIGGDNMSAYKIHMRKVRESVGSRRARAEKKP